MEKRSRQFQERFSSFFAWCCWIRLPDVLKNVFVKVNKQNNKTKNNLQRWFERSFKLGFLLSKRYSFIPQILHYNRCGEFHFPNCSMVIFTTTEIKWKKKFSNLKQLYKY
jgi:hypothetical protein